MPINPDGLYLEDLRVGAVYGGPSYTVSREEALEFARQYDPQAFHLDDRSAAESYFGRLALSGWQTAAVSMRLFVTGEFQLSGGMIGAGLDQLRWPRPVYPGDTLLLRVEVLEVKPSRSREDRGIVRLKNTTFNQAGEVVQEGLVSVVAWRRTGPASQPKS